MVEIVEDLRVEVVRANLERLQGEIADAVKRSGGTRGGRATVEVLAATKYVAPGDMPVLREAGVEVVGENRAQDLQEKVAAHGNMFRWDFIGQLQSRRVRVILPHVRLIHSVASESALQALERHRELASPGMGVLLEVNLAREGGKAGIRPERVGRYIGLSAFPVVGLMTMPPLAPEAEASRQWFSALRSLADEHDLEHLSMGTSQDYIVAVEEGATIVRLGSILYHR